MPPASPSEECRFIPGAGHDLLAGARPAGAEVVANWLRAGAPE